MKRITGILAGILLSANVCAANLWVEIDTSLGAISVELYADKAPKTVANFLQYVDSDFYRDTVFHRVIAGFMIQGGGFDEKLRQKPTRDPVGIESNNGLKNDKGTIAMARTQDPNSATAQFFVNLVDNGSLNYTAPTVRGYGYTVFGRVVKGLDVVENIAQMPTGPGGSFAQDVPKVPVVIKSIRRLEALAQNPAPAPAGGTASSRVQQSRGVSAAPSAAIAADRNRRVRTTDPTAATSTSSPAVNAAPKAGVGSTTAASEGNLYIVEETILEEWSNNRGGPVVRTRKRPSLLLLVAARSGEGALRVLQSAFDRFKQTEPKDDTMKLTATYRVAQECNGPNWGAVIDIELKQYAACGVGTPAEAIRAAAARCAANRGGSACTVAPQYSAISIIVHIGHSGVEIANNPLFSVYPAGAMSFPSRTASYSALWATTLQSSYEHNMLRNAEQAVSQFGQACGYREYAGTRSCWITSKNYTCIFQAPIDRQDKCIDRGLSAQGYAR